ncbi:MAG: glycosyltransferase WbuB [Pelagibacteraceae bacterium TMED124]|nr:hypothetical protein [Candidatus Neomarinimicrobiota bacterium]RPG16566.1 MAG: glycosyltransferase WbuB [Pelagibacteraceae bacterium TMED124]
MKILFINHFAGIPQKSDASLRHFNIARLQQRDNHQCSIITSSKSYQSKQKINTPQIFFDEIEYFFIDEFDSNKKNLFIKLLRMFSFSINLFWYFKKNYEKHNPDIVYASSPDLMTCLVAYYFSKKKHAKFVFEIRDIWPKSQVDLHNFSEKNPIIIFLKKIEIFLHNKSDKVVSNLPNYHNYLKKSAFSVNNYIHLPQFLDIKYYNKNYTECNISKEHQKIFHSFDHVCIFAGTIGSYYGINFMIDSIQSFNSSSDKKLALILIGDGDYRTKAENYLKKNNINDVFIIGTKNKSYLFNLIKKCSFSILSFPEKEIYQYGIASLKMFDYLYSGIPILMIGPFDKYSILKKSKNQFKSKFGILNEMLNEYHKLCNLDKAKRNEIKEDYKNILEKYCSAKTIKKELKEIFK